MNWLAFSISALSSNVLLCGLFFLFCKKPQWVNGLFSLVGPALKTSYIFIICALTAAGYSYGYIGLYGLYESKLISEAKLNVALIALIIVYGIVLSLLAKAGSINDEKMHAVLTLNVCIVLLCVAVYFWIYKFHSGATYIVALLFGRFFGLDNVNLKNFKDTGKTILGAVRWQGVIVTLLYFPILGLIFALANSNLISYEVLRGIGLGPCTIIITEVILILMYYYNERKQNKVDNGGEVEANVSENKISKKE